jgi:hypothetical protein
MRVGLNKSWADKRAGGSVFGRPSGSVFERRPQEQTRGARGTSPMGSVDDSVSYGLLGFGRHPWLSAPGHVDWSPHRLLYCSFKRATENSSFSKILPEYKVNIGFSNLDSPYECSVISWRIGRFAPPII